MPDNTDTPNNSPASDRLADLQRRVLDGDTSITGEDIAAARADLEVEELRNAGDDARRQAAQEAARRDKQEQALADLNRHLRDGLGPAQTAYGAVVAAISDLKAEIERWNQQFSRLRSTAAATGVNAAAYRDLSIRNSIEEFVQFALEDAAPMPPVAFRPSARGSRAVPRSHRLHTDDDIARLTDAVN